MADPGGRRRRAPDDRAGVLENARKIADMAVTADAALLKGLPKAKVQATFSPWTYKRLASSSACARPRPLPAPVTMATRLSKRIVIP